MAGKRADQVYNIFGGTGRKDYGADAFGGACRPQGHTPHRYIFTLFARKCDKIDVAHDVSAALIGFMRNADAVAQSAFSAMSGR